MAFPGSPNIDNITIDGAAILKVKPLSGSLLDVGCVANLKCAAKPITRDITLGTPAVGYDLEISGEGAETTAAMWANWVGARQCETVTAIGPINTCTLTGTIFGNIGAEISMTNKADSKFTFNYTKPGQTPAAAIAWHTASS